MENLITLLIFLLFIIVSRLLSPKKPKASGPVDLPPEDQLPEGQTRVETVRRQPTFEDALREIREALGQSTAPDPGSSPESPAPASPPAPSPARPFPQPRTTLPPKQRVPQPKRSEFRRTKPTRSVSALEDKFERKATFRGDNFKDLERARVRLEDHPHQSPLIQPTLVPPKPASKPKAKLNVKGLPSITPKDAVILAEILGPPRGLKPRSRS